MSAQHLRPLFAFVVVAIVGGLVFANALRAQDVVDAIRDGTSNVLAGTRRSRPVYVVEEGMRLGAAAAPEPEVDPSAGPAPAPADAGDEAAPSVGRRRAGPNARRGDRCRDRFDGQGHPAGTWPGSRQGSG